MHVDMRLSCRSELLLYLHEKSSVGFSDMGLNCALPLCLHKTGNTCWVDWSHPPASLCVECSDPLPSFD